MSRARPRLAGPWALVLGLLLVITAVNAYYIVPAGVLSVIQEELSVGPAGASLLVSVLFGVQMVFAVPVGMVLDRVDNVRATVAALALLVVVYGWSWQAARSGDFWMLVAARGAAAPLTSVVFTAGVNLVGGAFELDRRATALGVYTGGPTAGFAIGLFTGPIIAQQFGWPTIFVAYAVPAALGGLLVWIASGRVDIGDAEPSTPQLRDFARLVRTRAIWVVAFVSFAGFSLYAFVTNWAPTYISDVLGVSLSGAGLLAALFPAVGTVARVGSGAVSDRIFGHRRRPIVVLAFGVSSPAIVAMAAFPTVVVAVLALLLAGFCLQLGLGLTYTLARETAESDVAATGVAVVLAVGLLGGFVAPPIGGFLIEASGYLAAFAYAALMGVLGLALAWFVPEPGI